jgi:hypothetical protein
MSDWSDHIELRGRDEVKAFRTSDGREIPIPTIPNEFRKTGNGLAEWLDHLTLDELEAARQFYWDRWNWKSGLESDRHLSNLLDTTIFYRVLVIKRGGSNLGDRVTLDLSQRHV